MECENYWCNNKPNKKGFCKVCRKKERRNKCYVRNCTSKIEKDLKCSFHLKYRSFTITQNKFNNYLNINYDVKNNLNINYGNYDFDRLYSKLTIDLKIDLIFYIGINGKSFFVCNNNGDKMIVSVFKKKDFENISLYGPINLKEKPFHYKEQFSKLFICIVNYNHNGVKNLIIKNNNAIIIQKAWRLCRYDPSYKMCSKVQLGELERLGAL
jgi:hypothetical protein